MTLQFVDSKAHYTTLAQGNTKYGLSVAPSAGQGAFGTPGGKANPEQYNFTPSTNVEFGFFYTGDNGFGQWIFFTKGPNELIWVDWMGDGGIKFWTVGGSPTHARGALLAAIPSGTVMLNVQNHFRIKIKIHATTGTIDVWLNGVNVLSASGLNTTSYGESDVGSIKTYSANSSNVAGGYFSNIAIGTAAGDISGVQRLRALFPTGAGAHSDWTPLSGSNYANVDETTPNDDTDYNSSATLGNIDTYAIDDMPSDTIGISAIAVTVRLKKTDANSLLLAAVLRIGGVDYVHADHKGLPGGAYVYLQWIWAVSPATGVAFTLAEVNAMEAGIKIV